MIRQLFGLAAAALLLGAAPVSAATFAVNSPVDAIDAAAGDGICETATGACSLRAAVQEANALSGADTIMLPAGVFALTLAGADEEQAASGDLDVTGALTLTGAGTATSIIDGNGTDRVLDVFDGISADIAQLTLRNGNPGPDARGGGIFTTGNATLSRVAVSGNTAGISGGGVDNGGTLVLSDSTISGNTANRGGGIDNSSAATLLRSTVSGNSAASGAGISNDSELTLENVTISGNTASSTGGGVRNNVILTLSHVTLTANTAAGLGGAGLSNLSDVSVSYSIIASNTGESCSNFGTIVSDGHNVDSGSSCGLTGTGDRSGANPLLGPLQDNSGATLTHALLAGSPAIDIGTAGCPPPAVDQRGVTRPMDGNLDSTPACDAGAYEFEPGATGTTTTTTLPLCVPAASFASVACRLGELLTTVQGGIPAGGPRSKLEALVTKASAQVSLAEQQASQGKTRGAKAKLNKAQRALKKFTARLGSRKVKQLVPADLRAALQTMADTIRTDVVTLRSSVGA